MTVRVLPAGPRAVLVEVADAATVAQLHDWLRSAALAGVRSLVPAARTVLIEVAPERLAAVRSALAGFAPAAAVVASPASTREAVQIPVAYDGVDLQAVADACDISVEEVVRRHAARTYVAAFCGFSPGFAYLIGGDPALQLPRRPDPRTHVPEGSVAIAGEFSAVYPAASPGGWHLLGRSLVPVWSMDAERPALIEPGTTVRFVDTAAGSSA